MAHEIEPQERATPVPGTEVAPYQGGVVPQWYAPDQITVRPAWTDLHVPYRQSADGSMTGGKIYHHIITPLRAMALGFLWATHPDNLVPMLFCAVALLGVIVLIIVR